jgi:hypothetical protein
LSLNGFVGDVDRRLAVPTALYDEHLLLDAGVAPTCPQGLPRIRNCLYVKRASFGDSRQIDVLSTSQWRSC